MRFLFWLVALILAAQPVLAQPIPHPSNGRAFEEDIVTRVYIDLPADTLNWILQNVTSDREWHADFVHMHNGQADTVNDVGFRLRGNTSRYSGKKSFKISFNSFTSGGRWEGLKELNLNGEHNDPSMSRARMGWHLLSDVGLSASRSNHVRLYINGDYFGLYANIEHINDDFVERRYGGKAGNLYKCLWPASLAYLSNDPNDYKFTSSGRRAYELKTNKGADDYSDLANFIQVLNQTAIADLPCALEAIFDVNEYLYTLAFEISTGHWDDHANNQNNFYLYQSPEDGLMHFITFDLDNTFGVDWIGQDWTTKNIHAWGKQNNGYPLYDRVTSVPEYQLRLQLFLAAIDAQMSSNAYIARSLGYRDQLLGYVGPDPAYPLDYGYDSLDLYDAWHFPSGGHVKEGIFPFINQRVSNTQNQLISGNADPILWRPRLQGASNQGPIRATVVLLDEATPNSVLLQYRETGTTVWTAVDLYDDGMHGDGAAGDRTYGNGFSVSGSISQLDYRFAAQDVQGQLGQWPCTYATHSLHPFPAIVINEAQSANQNTVYDQNGDDSDWLELYNPSFSSTSLVGLYISDDPSDPDAFHFKGGSLAGQGHTVVWASDDSSLYDNHAPFKLSSGGDWLGLYFKDPSGSFHLLDEVQIPALAPDQSYGRITDGHMQWVVFDQHPTPWQNNAGTFGIPGDLTLDWRAFPNPFREAVWIDHESDLYKDVHLRITSALGQTVYEGDQQLPYRWEGAGPGLYYIEIYSGIHLTQTLTVIQVP